MNSKYHLILASKSPRRQELLKCLDLKFEVRSKSIDESYPANLPASEVAEYLSVKKSKAFGRLEDNELLITSDTVVISGPEVLGKAKDESEAKLMLQKLSGREHQVITGVCLRSNEKEVSFSEVTSVTFSKLSNEMVSYYINQYQPFDKAGAYGIQEWIGMVGISRIEGDYYNVMGLPLHSLYRQLEVF